MNHDSVIESSWLEKLALILLTKFSSQFISHHKTESDWLKFDNDSVFESIDSKTESPETMLIFTSQLDSITESWGNLSQSDSVFPGQTDSFFFLNESKWLDVYMGRNWDNMTHFLSHFDWEKILGLIWQVFYISITAML